MTLFYTGYNIILENDIYQKDLPAGKLSNRQFIELQFLEVIIMSRKTPFLTMKNREKLEAFLIDYLKEVFSDEEYITDFKKAYDEAYRVEIYGNRFLLTSGYIADWLRGLPLGTEYITYNIVCMLLKAVTGSEDYSLLDNYSEDEYTLDCYYWETLGRIILKEATKEE